MSEQSAKFKLSYVVSRESGMGITEVLIASVILIVVAAVSMTFIFDVRKDMIKMSASSEKIQTSTNLLTTIRAYDNATVMQTVLPEPTDPQGRRIVFGVDWQDVINGTYGTSLWSSSGNCDPTNIDRNCLRNAVNLVETTGGFGDFVDYEVQGALASVSSPDQFRYKVFTGQNIQNTMTWALNLYNNLSQGAGRLCSPGVTLTAEQFKKIHPDPNFPVPAGLVIDLCICPSDLAGDPNGLVCPRQAGAPSVSPPAVVSATVNDNLKLKVGMTVWKAWQPNDKPEFRADHDSNAATPDVNMKTAFSSHSLVSYTDTGAGNRFNDRPRFKTTLYACPAMSDEPVPQPCVSGSIAHTNLPGCEYCGLTPAQRADKIRRTSMPGIYVEFDPSTTAQLRTARAKIYYDYRRRITGTRDAVPITTSTEEIIRIGNIPDPDYPSQGIKVCYARRVVKPTVLHGPPYAMSEYQDAFDGSGNRIYDCASNLSVVFEASEPGLVGLCRLLDFEPLPGNTGTLTVDSDGGMSNLRGNLNKYKYCGLSALGPSKLNIVDRSNQVWSYREIKTSRPDSWGNESVELKWNLTAAPFNLVPPYIGLRGKVAFAVQPVDTAGNAARSVEKTPQRQSPGVLEPLGTDLTNNYLVKLNIGTPNCPRVPAPPIPGTDQFCPKNSPPPFNAPPFRDPTFVDDFGEECEGTRDDCRGWTGVYPDCTCEPCCGRPKLISTHSSCLTCSNPCPSSATSNTCIGQNVSWTCPDNGQVFSCPGTKLCLDYPTFIVCSVKTHSGTVLAGPPTATTPGWPACSNCSGTTDTTPTSVDCAIPSAFRVDGARLNGFLHGQVWVNGVKVAEGYANEAYDCNPTGFSISGGGVRIELNNLTGYTRGSLTLYGRYAGDPVQSTVSAPPGTDGPCPINPMIIPPPWGGGGGGGSSSTSGTTSGTTSGAGCSDPCGPEASTASTICSNITFPVSCGGQDYTCPGTKNCSGCAVPACPDAANYCQGTTYASTACPGQTCGGTKNCSCVCDSPSNHPYGTMYPDSCGNANACGPGTQKSCSDQCYTNYDCPGIPSGQCSSYGNCGDYVYYCQMGTGASCNTCVSTRFCNCYCFTADTRIDTPYGPIRIKDIRVGDEVYSFDEETKTRVIGRVGRLFKHENKPYGIVDFSNGVRMEVTAAHRVYLPEHNEWRAIGEVNVGEKLLYMDNEASIEVYLVSKDFSDPSRTADVYNFHVEKYMNYFVEGILVHNMKAEEIP